MSPVPRLALALALAVCCLAIGASAQSPPPLRESDGRTALPGTPAARVVSLAPSLTELVYAAGAGDKLAGVSAFSDFPPAAARLPKIADAGGIAWESLIAMQPDLVLAWKGGTRQADIERLHALGIKVFVVDISRFADVPRALRDIGRLVGRVDSAEHAAALLSQEMKRLVEQYAARLPVTVFLEISAKPLMTVNRDHVLSELLAACGGINVFADAPSLVSEPSREALLKRAPVAVLHARPTGTNLAMDSLIYDGLEAGRRGRVYGITADHAFRPGPRLLLAAREICEALERARESGGTPVRN